MTPEPLWRTLPQKRVRVRERDTTFHQSCPQELTSKTVPKQPEKPLQKSKSRIYERADRGSAAKFYMSNVSRIQVTTDHKGSALPMCDENCVPGSIVKVGMHKSIASLLQICRYMPHHHMHHFQKVCALHNQLFILRGRPREIVGR